jgi:hypothetical protein
MGVVVPRPPDPSARSVRPREGEGPKVHRRPVPRQSRWPTGPSGRVAWLRSKPEIPSARHCFFVGHDRTGLLHLAGVPAGRSWLSIEDSLTVHQARQIECSRTNSWPLDGRERAGWARAILRGQFCEDDQRHCPGRSPDISATSQRRPWSEQRQRTTDGSRRRARRQAGRQTGRARGGTTLGLDEQKSEEGPGGEYPST